MRSEGGEALANLAQYRASGTVDGAPVFPIQVVLVLKETYAPPFDWVNRPACVPC